MGLLEDLQNEGNFPRPLRAFCSICELLKKVTDKERTILQARLDDSKVTHTALSRVLRANDYNISDSVIGRHRRGSCQGGTRR